MRFDAVGGAIAPAVTLGVAIGRGREAAPHRDPRRVLEDRPSFAQARRRYLEVLDAVRLVMSRHMPTDSVWEPTADLGRSLGVPPFDGVVDAAEGWYGTSSEGHVTEGHWAAAAAAVTAVAAEHGFTAAAVIAEGDDYHVVSFFDPDTGAELQIVSQRATSVTIYGACFLDV